MIFPIICDLTRKLLSKNKPNKVYRETSEVLQGDSLKRYEEITKIFTNEFMYKVTKKGKNEDGTDFWFMEQTNDISETNNQNVEYIDLPTKEEWGKSWNEKIKSLLPKLKK